MQKVIFLGLLIIFWRVDPSQGQDLQAIRLNDKINSRIHDEITPVLSSDGKTLFFTRVGSSDFNKSLVIKGNDVYEYMKPHQYKSYLRKIYRSISNSYINDPYSSDCNQDIWVASGDKDTFDEVVHPGYPLNNALPNSVCAISSDQKSLIVINQMTKDGGMQAGFSIIRQQDDETWGKPEHMHIEGFNTSKPALNLTLSNDESIIILSLERKDSYGQNDLYVCHRIEGNNWSKPVNLGRSINTNYRETTPFLSPDNRTIYFSSNRRGTMGGNDIYLSKRIGSGWGNWTTPRRFKRPINSPANDSQPLFSESTGCLYFSSNRGGSSDIYKVKIAEPINKTKTAYNFNIEDASTHKPLDGEVYITDSKYFYPAKKNSKGRYNVNLPKGKTYTISFTKDGYLTQETVLDLKKDANNYNSLNIKMIPKEANVKIDLAPIYFERSKAIILDKSNSTLLKLANILKQNKGVHISIEGHTDNIGDKSLLMKLSRERASAVKTYLVVNGIPEYRIKTAGYGPNYPLSDNNTEGSKSLNRRVEVYITKVETL